MGIYATWMSITDDNHELTCATWKKATAAEVKSASTRAVDGNGRSFVPSGLPCDCPDKAPLIYQGSHVSPDETDARGGFVYVCAIPNHCHPDSRMGSDEGKPVEFLRLSVREDRATYGESMIGDATVVLERAQVKKLHETLTQWLKSDERW